jgi:hypothetical protein
MSGTSHARHSLLEIAGLSLIAGVAGTSYSSPAAHTFGASAGCGADVRPDYYWEKRAAGTEKRSRSLS